MTMVGHIELAANNGRLCRWLTKVKISRLLMVLMVIVILVPLVTHYYISRLASEAVDRHKSRIKLDKSDEVDLQKATNLVQRIDELKRIRRSVNNELRDLESRRQKLHSEATILNTQLEKLKNEYRHTEKSLTTLRVTLESAKLLQIELRDKSTPLIRAPRRLLPDLDSRTFKFNPKEQCRMVNCFDYSRCSVTSGFPVYVYPTVAATDDVTKKLTLDNVVRKNVYVTEDANVACLYILMVFGNVREEALSELPYWRGDGRNHLVIHLTPKSPPVLHYARSLLAQSTFTFSTYRPNYDVIIPPYVDDVDLLTLPKMVPIHRKYLISFLGQKTTNNSAGDDDLVKTLTRAQEEDKLLKFVFTCETTAGVAGDDSNCWSLCTDRLSLLNESTFSLIITPSDHDVLSTPALVTRLQEALRTGAVPVILGSDSVSLPFSEIIDWTKAAVQLPKARVTELHFILRALSHNDIFNYRLYGRQLFTRHFASWSGVFDTTLTLLRLRIGVPPLAVTDEASPSVFNASFVPLKSPAVDTEPETDDVLGPLEPPVPSRQYRDNFTQPRQSLRFGGDPFRLYPYTPFEPVLPSEAKFLGSGTGFRPIGRGQGGSGKEFNEALGGNHPREQFTVVMLTYEREAILINAIGRLKGLPHLNKVVVVWNSPKPPAADLIWPDIGVEVVIIRTKKNSLNNRFLPYQAIETEAILSIDDDAHLRHDEIMFGFRVWRESRERLVGFPGRYHAWDMRTDSWLYNSNYSCELSMVLTGAAFFHKYYTYMYSNVMSQTIRNKVDEYMNCEDLAMNFLVSHITRKPPLKVTSRWTFRCPGCPKALSFDDSHFQERHKCLNYFVKVYGYMPLLNTQFRADSVLFKTRIPHDKQKCFKFI